MLKTNKLIATETFTYDKNFQLESDEKLAGFQLAYTCHGNLNKNRDNVIWIVHALTANADPFEWWPGIVGKGDHFNPEEHFIICVNMLGSHYGSTSPLTINPETGTKYYHDFPLITIRDVVNAFDLLRLHLEITKVHTLIGGSTGGQQALEWSIKCPDIFERLILLACNAKHSPWGIAFNESQRLALEADETWLENKDDAGLKGLKAARSIALLSYRSYHTYEKTQSEEVEKLDEFKASSYQAYQGNKLVKRFNSFSYWFITKMMDTHDVGRGRGGLVKALSLIKARTKIIGISSDVLFPVMEQKYLQSHIANAEMSIIHSEMGHDGFLTEVEKITKIIQDFA